MATPATGKLRSVEIVDYTDEHESSVIALLSSHTRKDYLGRPELWNWISRENPFADAQSRRGFVVLEDSRVIGYTGTMPIRILYKGDEIDGAWSFDVLLSPDFRGKGYGTQLAAAVHGSKAVVLGLGISDVQAIIKRKQGCMVNEEIRQFFHYNRADTARTAARWGAQWAMRTFFNLRRRRDRRAVRSFTSRIVAASELPVGVDDLWSEVSGGYSKIVVRNHAYLRWKYGQNPITPHRVILVEDENGTLRGLGVIVCGLDFSRLVDFVGPANDVGIKYRVIESFIKSCARSRALECICSDPQLQIALRRFGFLPYKDNPRFYVHSSLDNDVEPARGWFVMGGDSDRPAGVSGPSP